MDRIRHDLRVALRGFARTPAFAITAIVILAIGIGMATTMITVYRTLLVDRLPVANQELLVAPHPVDRSGLAVDPALVDLPSLTRDSKAFASAGGIWHYGTATTTLLDHDRPITLEHTAATANLFDVLGARPYLGRLLRPEDGRVGAPMVMVLSYAAWRKHFNADPHVIGHRVHHPIFEQDLTIVGVAQPGLDYPAGVEFWDALTPTFAGMQLQLVARLKPGATTAQARDEFTRFLANGYAQHNIKTTLIGSNVVPFTEELFGKGRVIVSVLTAAVALLLIITCMNVGGLFLVRALGRSRELAIRRAIGASNGAVMQQLAVEASVIAAAGGILGFFLAAATLRILSAMTISNVPGLDALAVHAMPVAPALIATLVAFVVFGFGPSLNAARSSIATTLRLDTRAGVASRSNVILRQTIVAVQVALALTTIAGAALLVRSLVRLEHIDLGYQPEDLTIFYVSFPYAKYPNGYIQLGERIFPRIRSVPGVVAATPIESPPFYGDNKFIAHLAPAEMSNADAQSAPYIPFELGDADYFRTFGVHILKGRGFLATDDSASEKVVVVSRSLATRLWPGQEAVGHYLTDVGLGQTRYRVVGVAEDTHFRNLRASTAVVYFEYRQNFWNPYVAIRTHGPLAPILAAVQREVQTVEPGMVVSSPTTMNKYLDRPLAQPRVSSFVMSLFASIALMLSALGLYGVMSAIVRERTRELGIRLALGASPARLSLEVVRRSVGTLAIGVIAGLAVSLVANRALVGLLFEVKPVDAPTLAFSATALMVVGLVASLRPAYLAWTTDARVAMASD